MERGEVWWAGLPPPEGSGPGHRRPVLIVQSDAFNRSRIATVVVAVITSNLRLQEAPGNVLLPCGRSGLSQDSVANVSQLLTLDRRFLTERVGRVPVGTRKRVEEGLRLVLAL